MSKEVSLLMRLMVMLMMLIMLLIRLMMVTIMMLITIMMLVTIMMLITIMMLNQVILTVFLGSSSLESQAECPVWSVSLLLPCNEGPKKLKIVRYWSCLGRTLAS